MASFICVLHIYHSRRSLKDAIASRFKISKHDIEHGYNSDTKLKIYEFHSDFSTLELGQELIADYYQKDPNFKGQVQFWQIPNINEDVGFCITLPTAIAFYQADLGVLSESIPASQVDTELWDRILDTIDDVPFDDLEIDIDTYISLCDDWAREQMKQLTSHFTQKKFICLPY